MKTTPTFLLIVASLLSSCALEADGGEGIDVGQASAALYLPTGTNLWPAGIIPVCWASSAVSTTERRQKVKDLINGSWPAVANIEFTGWNACPPGAPGLLRIELADSIDSRSDPGFRGSTSAHTVSLGTSSPVFSNGLIPHEFGHALGFAEEMTRPDFVDDATGRCMMANLPTGNTLTTQPDRRSIMAATGYCHFGSQLSRWDRVGARTAYGTRADNVIMTANGELFARKRSNGDIYRRDAFGWTRIGNPGGQFIAVGNSLFALTPNAAAVWRYSGSGTNWTMVGTAATEILDCAGNLCGVAPEDGALWQLRNGTWSRISDESAQYASTSTTLFRIPLSRAAVQVFSASTNSWSNVGGPAAFIFTTNNTLYATNPVSGTIHRHLGGTTWEQAGGPGRHWVGAGNTLFGLTPTRDGVAQNLGGQNWIVVGGPADWIYGNRLGILHATHPTTKDIFRLNANTSWTNMGQP